MMEKVMTTSEEGIEAIKSHEAVVMKVYLDPVGLPTVGVGHLLTPEECSKWPVGHPVTEEVVNLLLRQDLKEAEEVVNECVTTQLSQKGFDALVSLVFNIGAGAFRKSSVLRTLNQGHVDLAANHILDWNKARDHNNKLIVLPGLVARRQSERELFLSGEMPGEVTTPHEQIA